MVPADVQQWIHQQLTALRYVDPSKTAADAIAALELQPNWRPRTEYINTADILLVLHAIDDPNSQIIVPKAYPWQSPLIVCRGVRKSTPPQTSLVAALQTADNPAIASTNFRPPLPQKPPAKPPLPPRASAAPLASHQPLTPPQLPPRVQNTQLPSQPLPQPVRPPSVPPSTHSLEYYASRVPPVPFPGTPQPGPSFTPHQIPFHRSPADSGAPVTATFQRASSPILLHQSPADRGTPVTAVLPSAEPLTAHPIDLMNAVSLSAPTGREELLSQLVDALNALPDPPQFASIDSDREQLLAAQTALQQRQAVLEQQKQQLKFNQTLLQTAMSSAQKICDLVDNQFVPPTLTDLVDVKPEMRAQARLKAISNTLDMLPRLLDAGMDVHVYLPLVRQFAREQFRQLPAGLGTA